MSKIVLYETQEQHVNLRPMSYTRPIADFRVGILTIREKWQRRISGVYLYSPAPCLREVFGDGSCVDKPAAGETMLFIDSEWLPDDGLADAVAALREGERLVSEGKVVAMRCSAESFHNRGDVEWRDVEYSPCKPPCNINYLYDIFLNNGVEIENDFRLLTHGRKGAPLPDTCVWIGKHKDDGVPRLFIEEGAKAECCSFNTNEGPIYIGKDAEVQEGSHLRGPIALCGNSRINMGTKIYGGTTIGPWSKVGGEINNAVIFGYSNKAHDGYLGNAVIGEWCNIGAGTNASNLKNDYSMVRQWNYAKRGFMRTQLQFCGLVMGDHSKIGINCMLNTATVIGVGVNLHGTGYPRVFIPSFSEGSPQSGFKDVSLDKFFTIAERVMSRRGVSLTDADKNLFEHVASEAKAFK